MKTESNPKTIANNLMRMFMHLENLLAIDPETKKYRYVQLDTGEEIRLNPNDRYLTQGCLFLTHAFLHAPAFETSDSEAIWDSILTELKETKNEDLLDLYDKFREAWNAALKESEGKPVDAFSVATMEISKIIGRKYFGFILSKTHSETHMKMFEVLHLYFLTLVKTWREFQSTGEWKSPNLQEQVAYTFKPFDLSYP